MLNPNALTSVGFVREYGDIGDASPELVEKLINSASTAIEKEYRRQFYPWTGTRMFEYEGSGRMNLDPWELRATTVLTVTPFGSSAIGYTVGLDYALSGLTDEQTFLAIRFGVRAARMNVPYLVHVTGDWGMLTVPEDVEEACAMVVLSTFHNPEGDESKEIGGDELDVVLSDTEPDTAFPSRAAQILENYRRPTGA